MLKVCNNILITIFALFPTCLVAGQDVRRQSAKTPVEGLGLGLHYGSIFAHSEAVQNTAGARPVGVALQYTWQRRDSLVYDLCKCYPQKGLVASYFDYDNEIIGKGLLAGWMLEPTWPLGENLQLHVKALGGLAFMSNPYHPENNAANQSYSTRVGAWLLYGMGLSYPVSPQWRMYVHGNFQHISNGGVKQPNKGVNWPTGSLTVVHTPKPAPYFKGQRSMNKNWKNELWRKDFALFGVAKRMANPNGTGTRLPVFGTMLQGSKQVGRLHALTLGAELSYDGTIREKLKNDSVVASAARVGLLAGHEFLLGRFIFSQRVGAYLYSPSPYYESWYHRWGVQYRVAEHWWAGINLKAHKHVADYFDFRLIYSW